MRNGNQGWSRRQFLQSAGLAGAFVSLGFPRRLAWAAEMGSAGDLRFVYYTDIHTRLEWDTPLALEKAAASINGRGSDLVLCGGDCITDGFDAALGADFIPPRWDAYLEMHRAIKGTIHTAIGNHDHVAAMPNSPSHPIALVLGSPICPQAPAGAKHPGVGSVKWRACHRPLGARAPAIRRVSGRSSK